jgi:UDP-N-acetylbacillosamine N-acetyltransferase
MYANERLIVMKHKLVIWGASGHALVVADILKLTSEYDVVGFVDNVNPISLETHFCGLPVFGKGPLKEQLQQIGVSHVIIAIGDCKARLRLAAWSCSQGFFLATAVHPNASIAKDVSLGAGSVVAAGAVINPGAVIGENVIVNTSASIDHECILDDGVHICPGAHLAGRVHVGRASWIGIGAAVVDRVRIGSDVMIGAGTVVVKDIPDSVLAYGVPAKVIKGL